MSDQSSNCDYENFVVSLVTVEAVRNRKARKNFVPVMLSPKSKNGTTVSIKGKVETGVMVSCIAASMLSQLGLTMNDLQPSHVRGMSGTDLQNCGTVDININCNTVTANTSFYVTKCKCAFVLGLIFCKKFKLVYIAPVCAQHSISMEAQEIEAVHIRSESLANYSQLKKMKF